MTIVKFFTAEEQKQILSMRENGYSIVNISMDMHRSRRNVSMFLNNPGNYMKLMKSHEQGNKPAAAATSTPVKKATTTPVKKKIDSSKTAKSPAKFSKSSSSSAATPSAQKHTPRELAEFNKVILEHRCVIKFLTKLGEPPKTVYSRLKKVYAPLHPELPAIRYWALQFRRGRQTILNDSLTVKKLSKTVLGKAKSKAGDTKNTSKIVKKKAHATTPKPVAKKVEKEEEPEPAKEETPAKFTIKLPGMDRLSKKSITAE